MPELSVLPLSTKDGRHDFTEVEALALIGIWIYDPGRGEECWSPGLYRLFSREPHGEPHCANEDVDKPAAGFFPSLMDRCPELEKPIADCLAGLFPRIRMQCKTFDNQGEPLELLFHAVRKQDSDDAHGYLLATITDVSTVEAPVSRSVLGEQLIQNALSFDEVFFFTIDTDERYSYLGGRGVPRFGNPSELLGRSITDIHASDSPFVTQVRLALDGESGKAVDSLNGSQFESRVSPLVGVDGVTCGVVGFAVDVTEKIQAHRSLAVSEKKYRTIFENSCEAICILDLQGRILISNPKAETFLGDTEGLHEGSRLIDHSPALQPGNRNSEQLLSDHLAKAAAGEPQHFDWAYRDASDRLIYVRVSLTAVLFDKERRIIHIAFDRSDQVVARRNAYLLSDIISSIQDGVFIIDAEFNILHANEAMVNLYRMVPPLIGQKCFMKKCGSDAICEDCSAAKAMKTRKSETQTYFEPEAGPEGRWIQQVSHPIIDQRRNAVMYCFNLVTDVTERIKGEKELEHYRHDLEAMVEERARQLSEREALLRSILETSSSMIVFLDSDSRITYANAAFVSALGYDEPDLIGRRLDDFCDGDVPESREERSARAALLAGKIERYRTEFPLKHYGGSRVWADVNASLVKDRDDRTVHLVCVMSNINDRRAMLRELKDAIATAEHAKAAADQANQAKSQFLAHMSHEIRTPLNGVLGLCDLLMKTNLVGKQLEYARLVRASGKSLLFLINDILDFSKIEAGKLELDIVRFDLPDLVESVVGMLGTRAETKGIELGLTITPDVPRLCFGDPGRIRQVLLNLVGNSIKFTENGGVRVHLAPVPTESEETIEDDAGLLLRFEIIDSGIGIPKDRIDRLFKSFSQADSTTSSKYGGTGLGLAISERLARMMGGDIGVESEDGIGSMFWFTIRLKVAKETEKSSPNTAERRRLLARLAGCKVLVVDDNRIQRAALSAQFGAWKMEVATASGIQETLALLHRENIVNGAPFRLLVVDDGLDGERGAALIEAVEADPQYALMGLVFLQSLIAEPDVEPDSWLEPDTEQAASGREAGSSALSLESRAVPVFKPATTSILLDALGSALFPTEISFTTAAQAAAATVGSDRGTGKSTFDSDSAVITPTGEDTACRRRGIHILVAEDNKVNQIVVTDMLLSAGFSCDVVDNGELACEAVEAKRYDIVLMDCQMPVLDGYDATRRIRQRYPRTPGKSGDKHSPLPIIALTANATREDEKRCFEAGMDAYCSKPINPKVLVRLIDEWAGKTMDEYTSHAKRTVPEITDKPLDLDRVVEQCGGNRAVARSVCEEFLHQSPRDLRKMEALLEQEEYSQIWTLVHSLKGTSGVMSAGKLHAVCEKVEQACLEKDAGEVAENLNILCAEIQRCMNYVQDYMGSLA